MENNIKLYYFSIRSTKSIDLKKLISILQTINEDNEKCSNIISMILFAKHFKLYTHIIKYLVYIKDNQRNIKILGITEIKNLNQYKRVIFLPI